VSLRGNQTEGVLSQRQVVEPLLFRPFGSGGPIPPVPTPVIETPTGVRRGRKRELIVRISDVQDKESTAEFLKSQLRLRNPLPEIVDRSAEIAAEKTRVRAQKQREKAALAAAESKRIKIVNDNNEAAMILVMIAANLDD
jgi:hypothetical protein